MDLNSLEINNPWWKNPKALDHDEHLNITKTPYYFDHPIKSELHLHTPGQSYIIRGPRQVGKTTMIKEKILEAIQKRIFSARHCIFLSCEAFANFEHLQEFLAKVLSQHKDHKILLCLDEVSFVKNWQQALLWLHNSGLLKNTVSLISGSDAHDLKISAERFPGRSVTEKRIYPYSCFDLGKIPFLKNHSPRDLLELHLKIGGFPHAIADYHNFGFVRDETHEIYVNWIMGDAHRYELSREILSHILFRIHETVGSQITWPRLIEKTPVKSFETAMAYVEHLESAFLCHTIPCYDPDKDMAAPRKAKKLYFIDPLLYSIAGAYLKGIRNVHEWWARQLKDPSQKGHFFEAVVMNHCKRYHDRVYYWYSSTQGREVDILLKSPEGFGLYEIKLNPNTKVEPALNQAVQLITPESFAASSLGQLPGPPTSQS